MGVHGNNSHIKRQQIGIQKVDTIEKQHYQ